MKKIWIFALIAALTFAFVGCNDADYVKTPDPLAVLEAGTGKKVVASDNPAAIGTVAADYTVTVVTTDQYKPWFKIVFSDHGLGTLTGGDKLVVGYVLVADDGKTTYKFSAKSDDPATGNATNISYNQELKPGFQTYTLTYPAAVTSATTEMMFEGAEVASSGNFRVKILNIEKQ